MQTTTLAKYALLLLICFVLKAVVSRFRTFLRHRKTISAHGCKAPPSCPQKDPFGISEIRDMTAALHARKFLERNCLQFQLNGNTYSSRHFGQQIISTIEPANVRAVLSANFDDYNIPWRRKNAFAPLLGKSLFQVDGHAWAKSRSILKTAFGHAQVSDLSRMETPVIEMLESLRSSSSRGLIVDLAPFFDHLAATFTTNFIRGDAVRSSSKGDGISESEFIAAMKAAGRGCEQRWQLGWFSFLVPQREYYRNIAKVQQYMDTYVDLALSQQNNKEDTPSNFLATLAGQMTDRTALRDEACMLFIAGTDAFSCLLTNMFFMIGKYAHIWRTLKEEVKGLEGRVPTLKELKALQYHRFCVQEALRLLPVLPSDSREARKDTVLPVGGGADGTAPVFVPAGGTVSFNIMALHRRKDLWGEDADEYRPERWQDSRPGWAYIPFLQGPRMCLGHELGMNQAMFVLARMAQTFKTMQRADNSPWIEAIAIGTSSADGAKVLLE